MRASGQRLTRERLMATAPVRGNLVVFRRSDPWRDGSVPVASLMGPDLTTYLIPPLDQVRIARWRGAQLVLVGLEESQTRKRSTYELQSWWVRLIVDAEPTTLQTMLNPAYTAADEA